MSNPSLGEAREREYRQLRARLEDLVRDVVPPGAVLLVVSRGDSALLGHRHCQARHFPADDIGQYAGHHPADSTDAIARLEKAVSAGATHLLIPSTAFWWLDYYDGFASHLARYRTPVDTEDCKIYELLTSRSAHRPVSREPAPDALSELVRALLPERCSVAWLTLVGGPVPTWPGVRLISVSDGELKDRCNELSLHPSEYLRRRGAAYAILPSATPAKIARTSEIIRKLRRGSRLVTLQRNLCEILLLTPTEDDDGGQA